MSPPEPEIEPGVMLSPQDGAGVDDGHDVGVKDFRMASMMSDSFPLDEQAATERGRQLVRARPGVQQVERAAMSRGGGGNAVVVSEGG